jgi:hypothetical protein
MLPKLIFNIPNAKLRIWLKAIKLIITISINTVRLAMAILALLCPFNIVPFPHRTPSNAITNTFIMSAPNKSPVARLGAFTTVIEARVVTISGHDVMNARNNIPIKLAEILPVLLILSA